MEHFPHLFVCVISFLCYRGTIYPVVPYTPLSVTLYASFFFSYPTSTILQRGLKAPVSQFSCSTIDGNSGRPCQSFLYVVLMVSKFRLTTRPHPTTVGFLGEGEVR
jgi:hypothetical protein